MKIRWFPITAALAAADQAAKCYAENKLAKGEERAITDKVVLRHVQNEGVCMSLLEDEPETARILAGKLFRPCHGKRDVRPGCCLAAAQPRGAGGFAA